MGRGEGGEKRESTKEREGGERSCVSETEEKWDGRDGREWRR